MNNEDYENRSAENPMPDNPQPQMNNSQSEGSVPPLQNGQNVPHQNYYAPPQYGNYYGGYYPNQQPAYAPPPKKRLSTGWVVFISVLIGIMAIAIIILSVIVVSRISDINEIKPAEDNTSVSEEIKSADAENNTTDNKVVINIPIAEKPVLEARLYADEATGLYTPEGVAKAVMPTQVMIKIFDDTPYAFSSAGSGIIITADGYILTNAHVVDGANNIDVTVYSGAVYKASIVGMDKECDVAVLKISPEEELTPAQFGDSDAVNIGEEVAAFGASGSLDTFATFGHVSGLQREVNTDYSSTEKLTCIQTDAALNPGNSGGALVNMYGQVIGMTVAGLSHDYYDNIGFALEINKVIPIAEDLMANGYVPGRSRIGIMYKAITTEMAEIYDVPVGICVMEVDPTCDVARKDVQPYDIITEINGVRVYNADTIAEAVKDKIAGDTVTMKIYRKSTSGEVTEFEVEVVLEQKFD